MFYVLAGALGFVAVQAFDVVSLKRLRHAKPVCWLLGSGLLGYGLVMTTLWPEKLPLPHWSSWLGWLLLAIALAQLAGALFINLPFRSTYIADSSGQRLVTTGLYALVRHPGVHGFVLLVLSLFLISRSSLFTIAGPVWIAADIVLVAIEDRFLFHRMFPGYASYRRQTPMLLPNKRSLKAFLESLGQSLKTKEAKNMSIMSELIAQGKHGELWQRYCGFIDLSLEDFMVIQRRLLTEQLELLDHCELGKVIMRGAAPRTVDEFREQVPLTTYADYAPYLLKRRMDVLPQKPLVWMHTSGRSGDYSFKWVPLTSRQYEEMTDVFVAIMLFGTCKRKGEVTLRGRDKILYALAPSPYFSGVTARCVEDAGLLRFLPPLDEAEKMEFADRIQQGFKMALFEGMDIFAGMSSILVAVGERFKEGNRKIAIGPLLRRPGALFRLTRGFVKSKLAGRPLLPKDIWSLKGVMAGGTDSTVFKEKIKEMWGCYPLNIYGNTEATIIAMQTWDYQGMVFVPNLNFLEFIPEEESLKSREDPSYQPATVLLDEVKAGGNYELVITNFHGGALVRYRIGDMVKIAARRNEQLNIDLPQMAFYSRVDDLIDIAGFTRLTEAVIWRALEKSGIAYKEWTVRKELKDRPELHLYLELCPGEEPDAEKIATAVHEELKKLDSDYANLESFTGIKPIKVTLLPAEAFQNYMLRKKAAGADLAHLKVPHINPSDNMMGILLGTEPGPIVVAKPREKETVQG
ncbi:MAG: GH3 auxin-responsive promoter family protein [Chloroflexi bacterium]|nr:GH3 auxin-responsive promoter family protein [Chloroflexota bacterium]